MTARGDWTRRGALIAGGRTLAAALICGTGSAQDAPGVWQAVTALPYRVQEIYPAVHAGAIHVAGGFLAGDGPLGPTRRHVRFEPGTDGWAERAALPAPRHHANLVSDGARVFALGGFTAASEGDWVMTDQTWRYDPEGDAWNAGAPAPEPHAETVCANLAGRLHVVGGRIPSGARNAAWNDHADTDRHLVYEPGADRWARAAPAPTARNSAAAAVIDGLVYVVGGRTVRNGNVADTEVYDPAEDRWRTAAPMPQGQGGLAAAALGSELVAFGGEYAGAAGSGVYAEAWRYDPGADRWTAVAPMPTPRHGLGAVTLGEWIYVVGGATRAGAAGTSAAVERFRLGR